MYKNHIDRLLFFSSSREKLKLKKVRQLKNSG